MSQAQAARQCLRACQGGRGMQRFSSITLNRQSVSRIHNGAILASSRSPSRRSNPITPLNAFNSRRFQSTQAQRTPAAFEQLPPAPATTTTTTNSTTDLFEQLSQTTPPVDITPHIGMLKEAGLDFGWGPTAMAQWAAEHMHVWAGLPWWGALFGLAVAHRLIWLWPAVRSSHYTAISQVIAPAQREIRDRYMKRDDLTPQQVMFAQSQEMKYLAKKTGYSTLGHFAPIVLQGIFSFGIFRFSRNLCATPGLGLEDSGPLWLANLTVSDPYYALPLLTSAFTFFMIRRNIRQQSLSRANPVFDMAKINAFMQYGLPSITFAVLAWQAAGLQIALSVLSIFTALQQVVLFSPSLRAMLKIQPFPKHAPKAVDVSGRIVGELGTDKDPLGALRSQMGWAGGLGRSASPQQKQLEKLRGKEALRSAQAFDKRRAKLRQEQSMRDNV